MSEDVKEFAKAFAITVTASTEESSCCVARKGTESIFSLLSRVSPQVCQQDVHRRRFQSKISLAEFNKVLEKQDEFERCRNRQRSLSSAGVWMWGSRRWLSPTDPNDRAMLHRGYDMLCASFPGSFVCLKSHFFDCIAEISDSWTRRLHDSRRKRHRPTEPAADISESISQHHSADHTTSIRDSPARSASSVHLALVPQPAPVADSPTHSLHGHFGRKIRGVLTLQDAVLWPRPEACPRGSFDLSPGALIAPPSTGPAAFHGFAAATGPSNGQRVSSEERKWAATPTAAAATPHATDFAFVAMPTHDPPVTAATAINARGGCWHRTTPRVSAPRAIWSSEDVLPADDCSGPSSVPPARCAALRPLSPPPPACSWGLGGAIYGSGSQAAAVAVVAARAGSDARLAGHDRPASLRCEESVACAGWAGAGDRSCNGGGGLAGRLAVEPWGGYGGSDGDDDAGADDGDDGRDRFGSGSGRERGRGDGENDADEEKQSGGGGGFGGGGAGRSRASEPRRHGSVNGAPASGLYSGNRSAAVGTWPETPSRSPAALRCRSFRAGNDAGGWAGPAASRRHPRQDTPASPWTRGGGGIEAAVEGEAAASNVGAGEARRRRRRVDNAGDEVDLLLHRRDEDLTEAGGAGGAGNSRKAGGPGYPGCGGGGGGRSRGGDWCAWLEGTWSGDEDRV